jgi:hypothetical protein
MDFYSILLVSDQQFFYSHPHGSPIHSLNRWSEPGL